MAKFSGFQTLVFEGSADGLGGGGDFGGGEGAVVEFEGVDVAGEGLVGFVLHGAVGQAAANGASAD